MVGKIPFVNNMSNRSDELLFVSIFSKSMFWSVAIIALRLVFIMLLVSLLYLSTEMASLVFGIRYTSPTRRLCFSISINIDSTSPSIFISMSSRRWYVRLSSTKIATPPLDFDCLLFAIRLYPGMLYNVVF